MIHCTRLHAVRLFVYARIACACLSMNCVSLPPCAGCLGPASVGHIAMQFNKLYVRAKGAGTFHSAGQSKEGYVGFGTSEHPIFMKLLPDHLWH